MQRLPALASSKNGNARLPSLFCGLAEHMSIATGLDAVNDADGVTVPTPPRALLGLRVERPLLSSRQFVFESVPS